MQPLPWVRLLITSSAAFGLVLAPPSEAQPPLPAGGEFQVNTYTTSQQTEPSVAMQSDGRFIVTWESFGSAGTDTSLGSIQGQRYDAHGVPLGAEFQINTYSTGHQSVPAVAAASNGDFVVVWTSAGSSYFFAIEMKRPLWLEDSLSTRANPNLG